jgi:hypothetical protein
MPLRQVLYLRVRASDRLEERLVDGSPVLVPLPGVDVRYSVEAVFWDGWWELLYWGRELEPAKALAQRVAARYDVPIRRCDDPHPRISGY